MSESGPFDNSSRRAPETDLSAEIVQSIERSYGQRVTCRKISGSNYRCNWWSPKTASSYDNPGMKGLLVTTHVVVKSRFITVERTEQGLVINDAPRGRQP